MFRSNEGPFTGTVNDIISCTFKNELNGVIFTHGVKKIKGAAHKNHDLDVMCK